MSLPLQQMLRDAAAVREALDSGVEHFVGPAAEQVGDLCCHVRALVEEVRMLERQVKAAATSIRLMGLHRPGD